jgi:signal transduction histidine kinase
MRTALSQWHGLEACVANLVPELQISIAPLRTCLRILRLDRGANGGMETERRQIELHLAQLLTLVDELLIISAIHQSQMRVSRTRVRLTTVISVALEVADPLIDNAGATLQVDIPVKPVWLDADRLLLGQALASLLLNAVRSAPNTGRILLRATPGVGELEMTIEASPGPHSATGPSLHLGVTLARLIVERHGGTLHAPIAEPGTGERVTLCLPLQRS